MRNVKLVKIEKPTETWEFNKKNILNQLFSYKKTYEFEFELEGGNEWGQKNQGCVLWPAPTNSRVSVHVEVGQRTPVQVWPRQAARVLAVEIRAGCSTAET